GRIAGSRCSLRARRPGPQLRTSPGDDPFAPGGRWSRPPRCAPVVEALPRAPLRAPSPLDLPWGRVAHWHGRAHPVWHASLLALDGQAVYGRCPLHPGLLLHRPHGGRLTVDPDGAPAAATPVRLPQPGRHRCGECALVQCPTAVSRAVVAPRVRHRPLSGSTRGACGAPSTGQPVSPREPPRSR